MVELHLLYAAAGTAAVVLALVSRRLRDLPLSEPLVALLLGVALGPAVLGLVELSGPSRDLVLLEGSRFIVAISVMGAALRFPASHLRSVLRPVLLLLAVVMPLTAAISGALTLLLGLPLGLAALIGATLCPTDPVLAGAVVTGDKAEKDIPERVRHTLTAESGINDGLALPLVGLAIAVVVPATTPGAEIGRLLLEVVGGTLIGAALGALAGWAVRVATADDDLEPAPNLILTVLLAVAVLGISRSLQTDGILAVFVAGMAYNALVTGDEREPQQDVDEAVNQYISLPIFLLLGVMLPWGDWADLGPLALVVAALVLVLRRLPLVLALARPLGLPVRQATFLGWYGPMGVSSLFYVGHAIHERVTDPRFFAIATLVVAVSVVAYGLTAAPGRRLYARVAERAGEPTGDDPGAPGG